jgi:hypothetical protein
MMIGNLLEMKDTIEASLEEPPRVTVCAITDFTNHCAAAHDPASLILNRPKTVSRSIDDPTQCMEVWHAQNPVGFELRAMAKRYFLG